MRKSLLVLNLWTLLGGLIVAASVWGCGGSAPPDQMTTNPPPPRPDMGGVCIPEGHRSSNAAQCCAPSNGDRAELDDVSSCCSGSSCCGSQNNSHHNGDQCACDAGYQWVSKADGDFRCVKQGKSDLAVTEFHFGYAIPNSKYDYLWICLNKNPDGSVQDRSEAIGVTNQGTKDSPPYRVAVGVVNNDEVHSCSSLLVNTAGTRAGATDQWKGPWCCSMYLGDITPGYYHFFALADVDKSVDEDNRENNTDVTTQTFWVP